jgi:hypothetical protein
MTRFSGFAQARPESKSKTYNDLAEGSTGFEALVRGADFFERVGPIDHWPNEPASNQWEDVSGEAPGGVGFLASGTRAHNGAQNMKPLSHDETEVDLGLRACGRADATEAA